MTGRVSRVTGAALLTGLLVASGASAANIDDQQLAAIVRQPILSATIAGDPAIAKVNGATITFKPLQQTGRHRHPVPVIGYVVSGRIRFQIAGQPEQILSAGQGFFEPAGTVVERFDNMSASDDAHFVAFYLMRTGDTKIIEPAP